MLPGNSYTAVPDPDEHIGIGRFRDDRNVTARVRVLRGIDEKIREHLTQPHGIGVNEERCERHAGRQRMPPEVDKRLRGLDRFGNDFGYIDACASHLYVLAVYTRRLEQIVHESRDLPQLSLNDAPRSTDEVRISGMPPQQLQGVRDGRERISQLVQEGREELLLAYEQGLQLLDLAFPCRLHKHQAL